MLKTLLKTYLLGVLLGVSLAFAVNGLLGLVFGPDLGRAFVVGMICGATGFLAAVKYTEG